MKKRPSLKVRSLAAAAGALAAGAGACDDFNVCDPPPPPLCDRLDWDPPLDVTADRTTAALADTIAFQGTITDERVRSIEVDPTAPAGRITGLTIDAQSFELRWTPRESEGGFRPGRHDIELYFYYVFSEEVGGSGNCSATDTIGVEIDDEGTATVVRLPHADTGLGLYVTAGIEAVPEDGGFRLTALADLNPGERGRARYRWRASSGTLVPDGAAARFVPDGDAESAVVQVEIRVGGRGLAIGSWRWTRGR